MAFAARSVKPLSRSAWVFSLFWLSLVGCSDSAEQSTSVVSRDTLYALPWEELEIYMKAAPSPIQVSAWLRHQKVPFLKGSLHDPTLAGRYAGLQGASNLGIYITDMAYAHATGNYQAAYEYLSAVHRLAARYGVEEVFSPERIRKLDKLQDRPDSAQKLIAQYYGEMQEKLNETGQQIMLRHMILGGWVESLHIISAILQKNPNNQSLAEAIVLQKSLAPLLLKLYGVDTLQSPASRQIYTHLLELKQQLETLSPSESMPKATVQQGLIQMTSSSKGSALSPEKLQLIQKPLSELRRYLAKI
ncbi:MAG: hypothetical protein RMK98_08210 [Bacteroidia bacterium]|nr:hypothetical protein [Bacteroidia bacterium]